MADTIPNDAPVVKTKRQSGPKLERPDSFTDEEWALASSIGNAAMAKQIVAVDNGVLPSDPEALNDFLVVTSGEATKALKRYVKLNSTIGRKLGAAYKEWQDHKKREARLFSIIANGGELPDKPDATPTTR